MCLLLINFSLGGLYKIRVKIAIFLTIIYNKGEEWLRRSPSRRRLIGCRTCARESGTKALILSTRLRPRLTKHLFWLVWKITLSFTIFQRRSWTMWRKTCFGRRCLRELLFSGRALLVHAFTSYNKARWRLRLRRKQPKSWNLVKGSDSWLFCMSFRGLPRLLR